MASIADSGVGAFARDDDDDTDADGDAPAVFVTLPPPLPLVADNNAPPPPPPPRSSPAHCPLPSIVAVEAGENRRAAVGAPNLEVKASENASVKARRALPSWQRTHTHVPIQYHSSNNNNHVRMKNER